MDVKIKLGAVIILVSFFVVHIPYFSTPTLFFNVVTVQS